MGGGTATDHEIRAVAQDRCALCGSPGDLVYRGLHDRLYNAPGSWNLRRCRSDECGLIWLDPMPIATDLWKAYRQYYTHGADERPTTSTVWKLLRRAYRACLRLTPLHFFRARLFRMYLGRERPGRLLEVGCGSGERLLDLRATGWEVVGQEVDAAAAGEAQKRGLDVRLGSLESLGLRDGSFDAVICNHVIEHVSNPVATLSDCYRLLKDRGIMVIVTPNIRSYGHRRFGWSWLSLDPPRHLHLFSTQTLEGAARRAGIARCQSWTSAVNAEIVAVGSYDIGATGRHRLGGRTSLWRRLRAVVFQVLALAAWLADRQSGEECVLWVRKTTPPDGMSAV
jgi:SAM-dependent methyltransferase